MFRLSSRKNVKTDLAIFFSRKIRDYFSKKKPSSKHYPFDLIDPYQVFGEGSGYENFYLVGRNWLDDIERPIAIGFGFNDWKFGFSAEYLHEYRVAFAPRKLNGMLAIKRLKRLKKKPNIFVVWGVNESFLLRYFIKSQDCGLYRMEDGFIRSAALGATHSTPYSLVLDKSGIYYDTGQPSDLETLLSTYSVEENANLLEQAKHCLTIIRELSLTKYNYTDLEVSGLKNNIKTRKRVAVLGQVDNDASIRLGNPDGWSPVDLIRLARYENPDAEVLFRPHPEVFKGFQKSRFKRKRIEFLATISAPDEPLAIFLDSIDHVYTISSLSGLEARLRGITVTTVGLPFYAGWGFTDDRVNVNSRNRKLSLEEFFTIAYLVYPLYLADMKDNYTGLMSALYRIDADRELALHDLCSEIDLGDINNAKMVAATNYWPKLFLGNDGDYDDKALAEILSAINFPKIFAHGEGNKLFQTVIIFLISGALLSNLSRDIFITKVRLHLDSGVLNDLLVHLKMYFPGAYIAAQFSWLLSEYGESALSVHILEDNIFAIKEQSKVAQIESSALDDEDKSHEIFHGKQFLEEELELSFKVLEQLFKDKRLKDAEKILRLLLLANFKVPKLIEMAARMAELCFDFSSMSSIAKLSQGINIYQANCYAVYTEFRAAKFIPPNSGIDFFRLLAKNILLKPDSIASVNFIIELYPETFDVPETRNIVRGMLDLDNEISQRKILSYLAVEDNSKAKKAIEAFIGRNNHSDMVQVLYSQVLSFNDETEKALSIMETARSIKVTSANIRESLRLCVLDAKYDLSLELISLAETYRIPLGDMHRRKAYFGNRMLAKAFETFKDIQLIRSVGIYYKDKYYRFETELSPDEKIFLLAIFGPGDEIRFASIYNLLDDLFSTRNISIACIPRLYDLFSRSFPKINFIPVARPRYIEKIDLQNYSNVPGSDIMSVVDNNAVNAIQSCDRVLFTTDLLHRCLPDYDSFPRTAYLFPNKDKSLSFRKRLPENLLLVGISWRSSLATHSRNEHYLTIEELSVLFDIPNIQFVNLQYDECADELAWVEAKFPGKLINFADLDQYNDFDGVAALMSCLDLIISSATTVIELAGALGCKAWLFSNSSELDWRKIDEKGNDVWHEKVEILEGQTRGDKSSLVSTLKNRLVDFVGYQKSTQ